MSRFSMWGKEDRAIQASWEPAASLFSENVDKEKTAYSFPSLCVGKLFGDWKHKASQVQQLIAPELHRNLQ